MLYSWPSCFIDSHSKLSEDSGRFCILHHYLQHLVQYLAYGMCSINNCWMNKQMNRSVRYTKHGEWSSFLEMRTLKLWVFMCLLNHGIYGWYTFGLSFCMTGQSSSSPRHRGKAMTSSCWFQKEAVFWKQNEGPGLQGRITTNCQF